MKTYLTFFILLSTSHLLWPQTSLPLSLHSSTDTTRALVFYVSGDGGFNKFSMSFMQTLNNLGYAVIGLNAKDYFWRKKTPQEAAAAIETAINESNKVWKKKNIVLIGYSFGANVVPFLQTHFSASMAGKVAHLILLSPSSKTDFEIHVLQLLGWGEDSGESVPGEINKISQPVSIIMGDDESGFPVGQLAAKHRRIIKMPGGHHYDGDVNALCKQIDSLTKALF
jgi:type IV secretory pathway VirJ component